MVPRTAYPPNRHHASLTIHVPPATVEIALAEFLTQLEKTPYLHPDAQLSTSGIAFAAQSGSKGGIAVHHLRRIEAGLRGEHLAVETFEELEREYGQGPDGIGRELPEGNDGVLDNVIGEKARKASLVADWAETTSEAAYGSSRHKQPDLGPDERDQTSYEQSQHMLEGEVGSRDTAHGQQVSRVPPVVRQADGMAGKAGKKSGVGQRSQDPKMARKEAKKARRKAEKAAGRSEG
ncbi:hypothetical protein LTR62_008637 [Meristemomyces frigidus]|uniref:Uncharacterized protein n=1 Tax=Meristemomyces frigidus TaxID=1508187 RepID=A0AAN7TAR1_9PEZI|nr:hypothetical protein LTR62_008637 [Meristemomyces frigidus]